MFCPSLSRLTCPDSSYGAKTGIRPVRTVKNKAALMGFQTVMIFRRWDAGNRGGWKRLCRPGLSGSDLQPCEHEYHELLDESGKSTHIWICNKCGRAKQAGLYAFDEPGPARETRSALDKWWVPDLAVCVDILRAVARGNRGDRAIYNSVKRELSSFEALSNYVEYLSGLGYLNNAAVGSGQSPRRRYEITGAGREALVTVSEGIELALEAFPRDGRRRRSKS